MRDYVQQLTVEQFGGMVSTATRTVGSGRGPYLGYTPKGTPLPVRFDATQAPRESRASAVLLIGTLGSGKTVAAQTIEYAAERRGSLVVDFDPKPDHGLHKLAELENRVGVLELSGDPAQQGKLDPLAIGLADLREELACSYLLELLPGSSSTWENAVSLAVKDTVREGSRSLSRVVELLLTSDRRRSMVCFAAPRSYPAFGVSSAAGWTPARAPCAFCSTRATVRCATRWWCPSAPCRQSAQRSATTTGYRSGALTPSRQ
jgi:hypothetical protein